MGIRRRKGSGGLEEMGELWGDGDVLMHNWVESLDCFFWGHARSGFPLPFLIMFEYQQAAIYRDTIHSLGALQLRSWLSLNSAALTERGAVFRPLRSLVWGLFVPYHFGSFGTILRDTRDTCV